VPWIGCGQSGDGTDTKAVSAPQSSPTEPTIQTKVELNIERFEQAQQHALSDHHAPDILPPDLTPVGVKAAAQKRFAQIWWSVRYPHGQRPAPTIEIVRGVIRCRVELSGEPEPGAGTDWTSFETKIDHLEPGRYRIIAPLREVTLEVPEKFVP
jgi:hypothetical protein